MDKEDEGQRLRKAGEAKAINAVSEEWKARFRRAVDLLIEDDKTFTSEDVVDLVGLPRNKVGKDMNNAVGAMMSSLSKQGKIVFAGRYQRSRHPQGHGARLAVWRGP